MRDKKDWYWPVMFAMLFGVWYGTVFSKQEERIRKDIRKLRELVERHVCGECGCALAEECDGEYYARMYPQPPCEWCGLTDTCRCFFEEERRRHEDEAAEWERGQGL